MRCWSMYIFVIVCISNIGKVWYARSRLFRTKSCKHRTQHNWDLVYSSSMCVIDVGMSAGNENRSGIARQCDVNDTHKKVNEKYTAN